MEFIFGLLCGTILVPVLEGLCSLILSGFEVIKNYFSYIITKNNCKIEQLKEKPCKSRIGFNVEVESDDI